VDNIIKKKGEKAFKQAYDFDLKYGECSQATIYALQSIYNIKNRDVFKGMGALAGGGIHRCDGSCGVYSAGIFFIGLFFGRDLEDLDKDPEDIAANKKLDILFYLSDKLYKKFIKAYGSINCNDIQRKLLGRQYFLRDKDEIKKFIDNGGYSKNGGPKVVGNGAKWTVEILESFLVKK
jgi:hypothetical protein